MSIDISVDALNTSEKLALMERLWEALSAGLLGTSCLGTVILKLYERRPSGRARHLRVSLA